MENNADPGRLILTPHPVLLDGQTNIVADLRPGESLYAFLQRNVDGLDGQQWHVAIGGRAVPRHMWHHVRPKHGQVIEVRGAVAKTALFIVAMIALTVFTMGIGTAAMIATYGAFAVGAMQAAVYMVGSLLINKVLGPKADKAKNASTGQNVYTLSAPRNQVRPYEPLGLLLGTLRIAPDLASNAYAWYEGDDQYLALILAPGVNVDHVDELYNGDALLSSFEGVQVYHNGFAGMPSEDIPFYSNADVVDGGTLLDTGTDPKHTPGQWVQRTGSADAIKLVVGVEFTLYDRTSKGGDKANTEQIQVQYRPTGSTEWQVFGNYTVTGSTPRQRRVSYTKDVAAGQYDVRVRTAGLNTDGSGAQANFTWATLTSVQQDEASYAGIPRIGVRLKATGQLNGAPDEIRCVAHSAPVPVWNGTDWVTQETSNPGAQILAYARGIVDETGRRIAGIGLPDEQIDIEALKGFMLHCAANAFTYDNWITDVRSHDDVLNAVALAGFGQISWASGRLSVIWAADEQPFSGVVNMATIKKGQFQVDYTLANAADGIEYSYLDSQAWEAKTLRVPAPGITTMLNPAQVSGEGVTSEAHAAQLARWHLAQSLYQYKSISYSTDIEHLSYRRLSLLALQHDLTQWGYGGRIMGASIAEGVVTLELDEEVPAPAAGSAFIGLRIPGERMYRVMQVQSFAGTSKTLRLVEAWPADAALPGNSSDNPAWDTIWIYDFKQTPGYRVRVTGIQPESDLKGAAVSVVAEGPEFWHYVKTGEYIPAPSQSALQTRPVASDLVVTERQVVQGDTVFTELQASWAITGPVGNTVVLSDLNGDAELEQVAASVTRSASWRIPHAGTYAIVVRPYNPDGMAGIAASTLYTTAGADAAPVLVDIFDVEEVSGGVRRYTWGFFTDTIQSADFAGVEIRYAPGLQSDPVWEEMTPLGNDGYHAIAFESVVPASGDWTIACRSRNTSGRLSTGMRVVQKHLGKNLGEIQAEQQGQIDQNTQDILNGFNQVAQEQQGLVEQLSQQAQELADQAQELAEQADALAQQGSDIAAQAAQIQALQSALDAPDWVSTAEYAAGSMVKHEGRLYSATQDVPAGIEPPNATYWQDLGDYSSLADQVAANSVAISVLQTDVTSIGGEVTAQGNALTALDSRVEDAEAGISGNTTAITNLNTRVTTAEGGITSNTNAITQLDTRLDTAEGNITSQGSALTALTTRVATAEGSITSQGNAITSLTSRVGDVEAGVSANSTAITNLQTLTTAQGSALTSQGAAITQLQSDIGSKADASAVTALTTRVTNVENTVSSQATAITSLQSSMGNIGGDNLLLNSSFEARTSDTAVPTNWSVNGVAPAYSYPASPLPGSNVVVRLDATSTASGQNLGIEPAVANRPKVVAGQKYTFSTFLRGTPTLQFRQIILYVDGSGNTLRTDNGPLTNPTDTLTRYAYTSPAAAPTGSVAARVLYRMYSTAASQAMYMEMDNAQFQQGEVATQWEPSISEVSNANAANASAITALTTRVTNAENSITSQATSITTLTSTVGQLNARGPNLVNDFGFESYADGATIYTASVGTIVAESTDVYAGSRAARLRRTVAPNSTNLDTYYGQFGDTSGGRVYYLEAVVKADLVTQPSPGSSQFRLGVNSQNSANTNAWTTVADLTKTVSTLTAWTKISGYVTVPAGHIRARPWLNMPGSTSVLDASVLIDNLMMQDVTDAYNANQAGIANASAITALTTRVTTAENTITSQGTAITNLQASVAGKADASALTALQATVTAQGNTITSQGTAITNVAATASSVRPNLMPNGSFELGMWPDGETAGWLAGQNSYWGVTCTHTNPSSINGGGHAFTSAPFPMSAGANYVLSWDGLLYASSGTIRMDLQFYDGNGSLITGTSVTTITVSPNKNFSDSDATRQQYAKQFIPPSNCASARVRFVWEGVTGCTAIGVRRVKVEQGQLPATVYSADQTLQTQASATQSLTARVTTAENGVASYNASWQVTLNANGYVTGVQSVNNGTKGTFTIVADNFNIVAPAGGARTEFSSGNWRVYDAAGTLRVRMGTWA
ncbi:host specificity factor TipJ family phage tail protein [Stenotrophomonas panacihumi]|nr:host specificity factor TipJ family phage tail protein [Stenotrophomonas panacihumi]